MASPMGASDVPADGLPQSTAPSESQPPAVGLQVVEQLDVAPAWAGHPVTFALITTQTQQFVAYYDAERRMTVASRMLDEARWQYSPLDSRVGWDSHNYLAMAIDGEGGIHVAGNMHSSPLVYFRSAAPLDGSRFEPLHRMIGRDETSATYPQFFIGPTGELVFAYRDGGSGNGNHIFNAYDPGSRSWRRLFETRSPTAKAPATPILWVPRRVQTACGTWSGCGAIRRTQRPTMTSATRAPAISSPGNRAPAGRSSCRSP